jgi:GT2 family glycosyltransferase
MKRGVSIVIPNWNGLALLQRFLPSVFAAADCYVDLTGSPVELIIVDDASTDESARWLVETGFRDTTPVVTEDRKATPAQTESGSSLERSESSPTLKLIRNAVNIGFGESCNRGFEAASHSLVLLLNNDLELNSDAIGHLVENFADPLVFAAHCHVFDLESGNECGTGKIGGFRRGFIRVHQSYVPAKSSTPAVPFYSIFAGGGSSMFDAQKFRDLGGFEPLLSPFYWEDVELSYRAWKRGFTVLYDHRSVARHRLSSTIGRLNQGHVRRIEQRNRLIYHWIHLQNRGMVASHIAWVLLLAVTAPLRLKPGFIASTVAAMKRLPAILRRRREERKAATRTDRQLFNLFSEFAKNHHVVVYDRDKEVESEK